MDWVERDELRQKYREPTYVERAEDATNYYHIPRYRQHGYDEGIIASCFPHGDDDPWQRQELEVGEGTALIFEHETYNVKARLEASGSRTDAFKCFIPEEIPRINFRYTEFWGNLAGEATIRDIDSILTSTFDPTPVRPR